MELTDGLLPLQADYCAVLAGFPGTSADGLASELPAFLTHNWQVQPLVYEVLKPSAIDSAAWRRFADSCMAIQAFSQVQLVALGECCDALAAGGVRYALLKSSALRLEAYTDPTQRTGWDIDLAVETCDLEAASDALQAIGFSFAQFNPGTRRFGPADPKLRAIVEAEHYELGFLVRRYRVKGLSTNHARAIRRTLSHGRHWHVDNDDELCCYATVDVHHGLSLEVSTSELVAGARPFLWGERKVWLPSKAWLAFHLIYKIYWEGVHAYGKGLYQYADLCRIIGMMTEVDEAPLVDLLESANLRPAAFYVLRRLPTAFRTTLPPIIAGYVSECGVPVEEDPIACNDLGDMWDKLWCRR